MEDYLKFLRTVYDDYHCNIRRNLDIHVEILTIEDEVKQELDKTLEYIDMRTLDGWAKANKFTTWKMTEILFYWGFLLDATINHHIEIEQTHENYDKKVHIKRLIKILYAEVICLKQFINLNLKIKKHC
jgi:hypothetical protein